MTWLQPGVTCFGYALELPQIIANYVTVLISIHIELEYKCHVRKPQASLA